MKSRKIFITSLIVFAIGLTACGTLPLAASTQSPAGTNTGQTVQNQPSGQNAAPIAVSSSGASDAAAPASSGLTYPIVDTNQTYCYDDSSSVPCPSDGQAFFGQDAQYTGNSPRYQDNGDGTVTDLVTGLMWQQDPGSKMTYDQAVAGASSLTLGDYNDWRLPTIKELYSLIDFSGTDASTCMEQGNCTSTPFIDTDYFHFQYGDTSAGERTIDSQWATSSVYTGTVFGGQQAMFGVNFADGRIKGYPTDAMRNGSSKTFFVIYVRGNTSYGVNNFINNGNGTVSDQATGLTWTQADSGQGLDWEGALNYCANLDYAGTSDWRLPNAKELQSIVDYSRSPDATNSAAIDPIFQISSITNEAGQLDYPAFWSSTTHMNSNGSSRAAVYVTFGRAMGYMNGQWMDVHGAGAQRAEDKSGDPSSYPTGHGPQGDAVRIYNYVRCVTGGTSGNIQTGGAADNTPVTRPQSPEGQTPQGQGQNQGQAQGQRQPPQAALDACNTFSQGMSCSVTNPNGTLDGTCQTVQSGQLACVPAGGPSGKMPLSQ